MDQEQLEKAAAANGQTVEQYTNWLMAQEDGDDDEPVMIHPFVADIMTVMMTETHNATNSVIENLMKEIRELKAWKEIVTGRILSLVDKPYAPNTRLFEEALFVDNTLIRVSAVHQKVYDFPGSDT